MKINKLFRHNFKFKILILIFLGFIVLSYGLILGLFFSPADYQQGEYVRIMYVHVPSAWLALGIYAAMGVCSFVFLVWRTPMTDLIAKKSAMIGAFFTLVTLITGSIWGKPIWGTWWVWDARLTSMLILFFFYLGYLIVINSESDFDLTNTAPAVLCVVGLVNVPIVKFSVEYWTCLHQKSSVFRLDGPTIHADMLKPLLVVFVGAAIISFCIVSLRVKTQLLLKKNLRSKLLLDKN
ncbi:MAG: heme ABC transporter permease [Rickettsiales bacterium]